MKDGPGLGISWEGISAIHRTFTSLTLRWPMLWRHTGALGSYLSVFERRNHRSGKGVPADSPTNLGLLPQLLDWIEEDMRKIMAPGTENSLAQMEGSGVQPVREEPTDPSHKIKNKKTPSSRGEPSKLGDTGKRKGNLSPSRIIARQSFVWALCANRKLLDATQSDVYGWLSREEIRGEEENPYNGTKMPQSETWMRYLREACDTEALRDEIERHWLQADQEGQSVVYVKNIQFHSSQKAD